MAAKDILCVAAEVAAAAAGVVGPVQAEANVPSVENGGGAADTMPVTRWQKLRLVGLVILKRLRFIAILAAVGLFIGYWDTVMNYWDKWTRPRSVAVPRA